MENEYKHTNTTVSLIHYHFVFCPRYRRKIFKIEGVEERLKELIASICKEHEMDILALECHIDHVHLFLSAYPQQSIPDIMRWIKGTTSHVLRTEFSALKAMPALWTRNCRDGQFGYDQTVCGNTKIEALTCIP